VPTFCSGLMTYSKIKHGRLAFDPTSETPIESMPKADSFFHSGLE
jgi:hypothetical protein